LKIGENIEQNKEKSKENEGRGIRCAICALEEE